MVSNFFRLLLGVTMLTFSWGAGAQSSVSATYTAGDIPTSFAAFDPACNGSNIILDVTLPEGDAYTVTGINISYTMTASGSGQMSHQRSQVKFVNRNTTEFFTSTGTGNTTGTFAYNRTATIANGTYAGGTVLRFELHAWRTVEITPGCNTSANKVDAGTWAITVNHSAEIVTGKTGINKGTPVSTLDVFGKIRVGDDIVAPAPGMIRWNSSTNDFEGYNGSQWVSFTGKNNSGWGATPEPAAFENSSSGSLLGTFDQFGYSVSISGDYAVAGSAQGNYALVYKRNGAQWQAQAELRAADNDIAGDNFGYSVSINGDYAIVGAPGKNSGQGKAYVFVRSGTVWNRQAILTASDGVPGDGFGFRVSMSGEYAIAGAPLKDGVAINTGKAYVFFRTGTLWNEQAALTGGANPDDLFGYSVGISGNNVIVGMISLSDSRIGKAYIFNRTGTTWLQEAILSPSDAGVAHFGASVSISGNDAIVGYNGIIPPGFYPFYSLPKNKAYVFSKSGTSWIEQAILTPGDAAISDHFGYSVSLSGDYAIVGAPFRNSGSVSSLGKVYVFSRSASNWNQQAVLLPSDGADLDLFGYSSCISGIYIIAGIGSQTRSRIYFFNKQ